MTQEEKELLLKDLCGRLCYGIFVKENRDSMDNDPVVYTIDYHPCINDCKPYLRPMSSMTEEEKKEISELLDASIEIDSDGDITYLVGYATIPCSDYQVYIDYLNAHHFDYRGLIPMGLGLEAPKDMYKIK